MAFTRYLVPIDRSSEIVIRTTGVPGRQYRRSEWRYAYVTGPKVSSTPTRPIYETMRIGVGAMTAYTDIIISLLGKQYDIRCGPTGACRVFAASDLDNPVGCLAIIRDLTLEQVPADRVLRVPVFEIAPITANNAGDHQIVGPSKYLIGWPAWFADDRFPSLGEAAFSSPPIQGLPGWDSQVSMTVNVTTNSKFTFDEFGVNPPTAQLLVGGTGMWANQTTTRWALRRRVLWQKYKQPVRNYQPNRQIFAEDRIAAWPSGFRFTPTPSFLCPHK